jgi:DNA polymerase-3 subunit delta
VKLLASAYAQKQNIPHGYTAIESDLKDGQVASARAVLLCGSEAFLTETYEKRLRDCYINKAAEMFDALRFEGDNFSADDVIGACDTLPMLSERRVVVVANMPGDERTLASENAKRLAEYLPRIPAMTLLIITAGNFSKRSALYKVIASKDGGGRVYEFGRLGKTDARNFIRSRFKRTGVAADAGAVDEILSVSGYLDREAEGDLYLLDGDVNLVAAYAASAGGKVTVADVRACLGVSVESDVFSLLDAVSSGAKGKALELAHAIASKDENTFGLIALLTGQFEIMLGYSELKNAGMNYAEMARTLGIKSEFRLKKAAGFASRYTEKRLLELLHRLYRVDSDIKSGVYDERLALTMFIAEM